MQGKKIIGLFDRYLRTFILGYLMLLPTFSIKAQLPTDTIDPLTLNQDLIQHLIIKGIDSLRRSCGARELMRDSILTLAAGDQAAYLIRSREAGHQQPLRQKSTVNRRVEYYGGKGILCGENIAITYVSELMEDKRSLRQYYNHTYLDLAGEFVRLWAQSNGHFQNATNPLYNFTGIFVEIHPVTHRAAAVQVFGYKPQQP